METIWYRELRDDDSSYSIQNYRNPRVSDQIIVTWVLFPSNWDLKNTLGLKEENMTLRWKTPTQDISAFLGNCPPQTRIRVPKKEDFFVGTNKNESLEHKGWSYQILLVDDTITKLLGLENFDQKAQGVPHWMRDVNIGVETLLKIDPKEWKRKEFHLGGGFKYFVCSPLVGGRFPIWLIFSNGLKPSTSHVLESQY